MTPEQWSRMTAQQQSAHIAQFGPPPPNYYGATSLVAPAKRRRRWPWIVLGVLGVAVLIGVINGPRTAPSSVGAGPIAANTTQAAVPAATPLAAAPPAAPAAAPAPAGPVTTVGDGEYQVGVDVAPGRYKTPGPDPSGAFPLCYWERDKNDSGDFNSIIANDLFKGPGVVTVRAGEFAKLTGGCTWTKQQ